MTDTDITAHIPDEAVQAAIKSFESTDNNCEAYQDMRKAIAAALPFLSAPCAVEVVDRNTLLSIPVIHNDSMDNLGIALASYFEGHLYCPEDGEMNDTDTWKQWALDKTNDLADRILSCVVTKPVDVAAVRNQAFDALKKAEQFIENGVELGFIKLPDSDDPALETLPKIKEAIRSLSAEPALGEYSASDELRDLHQSILQSNTLNDFNAIKRTVELLAAPTPAASRAALAQGGE